MIEQLVEYSRINQLTHVPSALSMLTYVDTLFREKYIQPYRDRIVIGKPFGSQAYYLVWKDLGYIDKIDNLSVGVKHEEIDFVDYGEETMGNALGVATGLAISNPDQTIWVNITDATLQMGSTLEAIQYIGHNNIKNILLTVDYNDCQVTGKTHSVLSVSPVVKFIENNMWDVIDVPGHAVNIIKDLFPVHRNHPTTIIFKTTKGYGVPYMEKDPIKWHYQPIKPIG